MVRQISSKSESVVKVAELDHHVGEVIELSSSDLERNDGDISNGDLALKLAKEGKGITYTEEEESSLVRKLDLNVTLLLCVVYGTQFMDKVTISFTGIMGLRDDLELKGNQFSWLTTAFYLGWLSFEFLSVRLLQRFPLMKTMSAFVFVWGSVQILNAAAAFNFGGMLTARFFLGAMESAISPAAVMLTAQYYKKDEQFQRNTFWWSSNGVGNILGAALAYGLAKHEESMTIKAWKLLFLVTGIFTLLLSVILFFHLPDTPNEAWFLTEKERKISVERIRVNQQGFGNPKFKRYQAIEAFKDIRTYLYITHGIISTVPNGALTSFGSILIKDSFGYSELQALLLSMPNGACQFLSSFFLFYAIKYFGNRTLCGIAGYSVAFIACCLLAFPENKTAQFVGYVFSAVVHIGWVTVISMITTNTLGYTKKGVVMGLYLVSYCVGNMIGPQTFQEKWAPDYRQSKVIMAACSAASLFLMVIMYLVNIKENKRRDNLSSDHTTHQPELPENYEFMDLTDFENFKFRYVV
ncbi:putative membrane protein [Wickerhamomyces ciferrii]|uniref:Membrane protein n=1 Tax=Wickerhamomyces ciferrii (strain ATCC 14091 / BCRC 22168 / CBS 111 / JCM 3599 / NBRC 0793 / NRRL Y-1031 F-60-10) TaxID=1206466 RepID=K0KBI9_WICCF|nr:uncharacterized protein BN7_1940 [Wickerhamomyces ciferrii]CCH42395.1 putative membrane protein [Wickerhamomyces ciferrii]